MYPVLHSCLVQLHAEVEVPLLPAARQHPLGMLRAVWKRAHGRRRCLGQRRDDRVVCNLGERQPIMLCEPNHVKEVLHGAAVWSYAATRAVVERVEGAGRVGVERVCAYELVHNLDGDLLVLAQRGEVDVARGLCVAKVRGRAEKESCHARADQQANVARRLGAARRAGRGGTIGI
eukprot:6213464-Pleurochrysis_carterae.AAC.1